MPKPLAAKSSFLEQVADQRDLNKVKPCASAQIATMGKAASSSLITGIAAKAAEQLGANGQRMDPLEPSTDSTESDLRQIFQYSFLELW